MGTPGFMTIKLPFEVYMLIPSKATSPGVSIPMEANLSRTTDMLSLWSGRYSSITSALLFLPSLLPVLRGI